MQNPSLLHALVLLAPGLCAGPGLAQQTLEARKVTSPVKDLGTYHLPSRTWTRANGGQANAGADVIYRNDAFSGYFGVGFEDCTVMDEIILPSTEHPAPNTGPGDEYKIDCWTFSYCAAGAGTVTFTFEFTDGYYPCDVPDAAAACSPVFCQVSSVSDLVISGLPGGAGTTGVACWGVTITLADGYEFCMQADGGGCTANAGYQGAGLGQDWGSIGFSWSFTGASLSGPVLGGNPAWVPKGYNTCYNPGNAPCAPGTGTGLGSTVVGASPYQEGFGLCNSSPLCMATGGPGCYWFGGYSTTQPCTANRPLSQFMWTLQTDSCDDGCTIIEPGFCDESTDPDNVADISISSNSLGVPGGITVDATNVPPGVNGFLVVGEDTDAVVPPGSKGTFCIVGGCTGRYGMDLQNSGSSGTFSTNIKTPMTACGMMGSGDYCLPGGCGGTNIMAGDTYNFQYWHRQPMMAPSSFSSAITVPFTN